MELECPVVNDTADDESLWFIRIVLGEDDRNTDLTQCSLLYRVAVSI